MEKKGIKKMATVAVASAAVGAGLGIMFAPKKGSDTRKDIMKALNKVADKVKNFSKEDVKKDFEKKIKSIEKRLESLNNEKEVKKVHKKANELKDSVEDLWNSAYEKGDEVIQKAVDELKTKVNKAISSIEKHLED